MDGCFTHCTSDDRSEKNGDVSLAEWSRSDHSDRKMPYAEGCTEMGKQWRGSMLSSQMDVGFPPGLKWVTAQHKLPGTVYTVCQIQLDSCLSTQRLWLRVGWVRVKQEARIHTPDRLPSNPSDGGTKSLLFWRGDSHVTEMLALRWRVLMVHGLISTTRGRREMATWLH